MQKERKIVIISGVSGNLGKSVALKFLEKDNFVIGFHSKRTDSQVLYQDFAHHVEKIAFFSCDITNEQEISSIVRTIIEQYEKIDILCNLAGLYIPKMKIENVKMEDWENSFSVNLTSIFITTKNVLPFMKSAKYGRIINISAMPGVKVEEERGAYGIAKSGVKYFTEMVAKELKSETNSDITINAIAPGIISENTSDSSTGNVSKADIVEMIMYLCSENAKTINGSTINMFGNL